MLKKLLCISLFVLISSFVHKSSVNAMVYDIDPEKISHVPVQTKNGKGVNFNTLGSFEEEFIKDCRDLEISENSLIPNILLEGEAYGRLSMRVLRDTPSGLSNIFVNELSAENLHSFNNKIEQMKKSEKTTEVLLASRVTSLIGDCLNLETFKGHSINNLFDLIMCANVLHFFDGEQVLNFFINTFNFLKPGAKVYIFTQSRTIDLSYEEIMKSGNLSYIGMKTYAGTMKAAQDNSQILLPGLIHDEWLCKTPVLNLAFTSKPNGLGLVNYIPEKTFQSISDKLGFEMISTRYYEPRQYNSQLGKGYLLNMNEVENGEYLGLILKKPAGYAGGQVTIDTLDPDFVKACRKAKDEMKTFIDTKLNFPKGYPFVEIKK